MKRGASSSCRQGASLSCRLTTRRYHESMDNLTPADVYTGLGDAVRLERQRIKRQTLLHRRLQHIQHAA